MWHFGATVRAAYKCANPALGRLTGRDAGDLLGEPMTAIVVPGDVSALESDLVAVLIGAAHGFTREVRVVRPDGTGIWTILVAGVLPHAHRDHVELVVNIMPAEAPRHPHARLHRLAYRDRLTDLYNRAWLDEELARLLAQPRDEHRPGAVLMIDLDNLKLVNDKLGHEQGDRYLAAAAVAMREALRPTDALVRFGGDEFVALLPHTDVGGAMGVARFMRRHLGVQTVASRHEAMTASIGVAMFPLDTRIDGAA